MRWKHEDRIDAILDGIEAVAAALRAERLEAERREQERHRREQERLRREEEERRERERRDQLGRDIEAWRLARDIRAYVTEMRQVVATLGAKTPARLDWALRYADEIDPIATASAQIRGRKVHRRVAVVKNLRRVLRQAD